MNSPNSSYNNLMIATSSKIIKRSSVPGVHSINISLGSKPLYAWLLSLPIEKVYPSGTLSIIKLPYFWLIYVPLSLSESQYSKISLFFSPYHIKDL